MSQGNGYVIPFEDKLKCSICQGRLKDARVLLCGHTYCMSCVTGAVQANGGWNNIKCPECKKSSQLPPGGANALPRCFTTNSLLDEIAQTFGSRRSSSSSSTSTSSQRQGGNHGNTISIGPHGFQTKEIFQCSVCYDPMADGRYLPCGHSYCKGCLLRYPLTGQGRIRCSKCQVEHSLPAGGAAALPVTYRINSIVAEMRAEDTGSETGSSGRVANGHAVPVGRHSASQSTTTMMEDVDEAKRRAQAQIQVFVRKNDGKTITIDISRKDLVQTLKKAIQTKIGLAPSQQNLTYGGSCLEDRRTLESYGIGNHSNIELAGRLRGGN